MISYFGGKNRMSNFITPYIPENITTYVEVFSGAFWIYFNGYFNDNVKIIYNDLNVHISNVFSCSKNYNRFIQEIESALNGGWLDPQSTNHDEIVSFYKEKYYEIVHDKSENNFLDNWNFSIPDYDKAVKYAFMITSAFNGCFPRAAGFSGISKSKNKTRSKLEVFLDKLKNEKFQNKLDKISLIETLDFEELIKKYDSESTFFYLDPPYKNKEKFYGVNNDNFGSEGHERLSNILKNIKGRFALSYYMYDDLNEWYPNDKFIWEKEEFFRSSASFSKSEEEKGEELLIMNYSTTKEDYKYNLDKINKLTKKR